MTWQEVVEHPSLQDLPFKIELNGDGNIIMSPTFNFHGGRQVQIALLLTQQLPHGKAGVEIGVQTSDNVKVPDVVWFTPEHWRIAESERACSTAPTICVEVASEGNSARELNAKKVLYFEAGAQEVWFCDTFGNMSFFTLAGPAATSPMCPDFPASV